MTPFMHFRFWLTRASVAGKASTAVGSAISVALLIWIAVPGTNSVNSVAVGTLPNPGSVTSQGGASQAIGSVGSSSASGAAGASGSLTPGGTSSNPGSSGAISAGSRGSGTAISGGAAGTRALPAGSSGQGGAAGASSSSCAGSGPPIKLGVVLLDIGTGSASLNGTFGIPQPSEQQADYQAVMDAVNKAGGVACHPLVGVYQVYNELDASTATSDCLTFAQDHVFAVLNGFLPTATDATCLQNHLPMIEEIPIPNATLKEFYPYYFSINADLDVLFNNAAHALGQMNFFSASKGFKKLGILYRDCISGEYQTWVSDVETVGVTPAEISSFDVGCPSGLAAPSTVEQAVLQFQRDGVTTVSPIGESGDLQEFTKTANGQGFKPQYVLPDEGTVATSGSPAFEPDPTNFSGAIAITPSQYGAIGSNLPESAATKACDQIMTSHGLPTVYQSGDQFAGAVCNEIWFFQAAADHDPGLTQTGLAGGLTQAGTVPMAFPEGPNSFSRPGTTTGGQYWRPATFDGSCGCWKVVNPTFQPSF